MKLGPCKFQIFLSVQKFYTIRSTFSHSWKLLHQSALYLWLQADQAALYYSRAARSYSYEKFILLQLVTSEPYWLTGSPVQSIVQRTLFCRTFKN